MKFNKNIAPTSKPLAVSTVFKNDPGPVFTAFSPVKTQRDFSHPLRSFDHQTSFSKVHPQGTGFKPRSHQGNVDTPPYEFKYDVSDASYGTSFNVQVALCKKVYISDSLSKQEAGDGLGNVDGSYSVTLPDGRVQQVSYHSDSPGGYTAQVNYLRSSQ